MINMIILVVFALIGLVVGYLAISIKLSKAKEQAENYLAKGRTRRCEPSQSGGT